MYTVILKKKVNLSKRITKRVNLGKIRIPTEKLIKTVKEG